MSDESPEELPPKFLFGDYAIEACIGRGAMARVYSARNRVTRARVALKVLDRWVHKHPAGKERFLREARVAAAIKHPNVVNILDVGVWKDRQFIVMELLEGHDLDEHLEKVGPLSPQELVAIALPVISGMLAVHGAGVVHRDLKPSNIFLCRSATGELLPKVLDFGISKFSSALDESSSSPTRTRDVVGTPTNMAPEALNGVRELGPKADQYSLGTVLYECAVGRPPFQGETLLELLKEVALGKIALPRSVRPEIPVELEVAILRALHTAPEARFDSLLQLGQALWPLGEETTRETWEDEFGYDQEPVTLVTMPKALSPRPEPLHFVDPPPPRRRPRTAVALLLIGALCGMGLFAMCVESKPSDGQAARKANSVGGTAPSASLQEKHLAAKPAASTPPDDLVAGSAREARSTSEAEEDEPRAAQNEPRAAQQSGKRHARTPARGRTRPKTFRRRVSLGRSATDNARASTRVASPQTNPTDPGSDADSDLAGWFGLAKTESASGDSTPAAARSSEVSELFDSPQRDQATTGVNDSPLLD